MAVTVAPSAAELPSAYASLLSTCRDRVRTWAAATPWHAALEPYVAGGKYLRPLIALAAADAAGGEPGAALPAAEAVELVHAASLVHDDIIDRADTRRGMPAAHVALGEASALVAGDALLLRGVGVLAAAPGWGGCAVTMLHEDGLACCCGQLAELQAGPGIGVDGYRRLAEAKTGRLFMAAAGLGAMLAGGSPETIATLRAFARRAGVAYQVRDDVLDVVGDADVVGKPIGNSAANARPTLPRILGRGDEGAGLAAATAIADGAAADALLALDGLPGARGVAVLEEIARWGTVRAR